MQTINPEELKDRLESAERCYAEGDYQRAKSIFENVLSIDADNLDALSRISEICYHIGEYDSAIDYLKRILQLYPDNPEIYNNIGLLLHNQGRIDEAMQYYQRSLEINPQMDAALYNLGNSYKAKKLFDESIACYEKAAAINPSFADAHNNLGLALREKGEYDKAAASYERALELKPNAAETYYNLGIVEQERNRLDKAVACYRKAIELNPSFSEAYNNLGFVYKKLNRLAEAITCYRKATELSPDFAEAHWNLSFALLTVGNYKEGWKEYEWRFKTKEIISIPRHFSQPGWDGSDIRRKTIFLFGEQGFGDTIQFIRYAPLVAQGGARVIVECREELVSLIKSVPGIDSVMASGHKLPDFDTYCPIMSLPMVFDTRIENIPAEVPYILVDPEKRAAWKSKVSLDRDTFKIGLVWAANPLFKNDHSRSFPIDSYFPLMKSDNISWYSLQKGHASSQARKISGLMTFHDYTAELHDFSDTAALIDNLDLIISVDTSVAHLAGAIGKPVWILLSHEPDWRWLLEREDSPWYPTAKLFRQSVPGDWPSIITRITKNLNNLLK